ncbi:hypothetical protein K439DRAFT_1660645 [Ramaria rubella]|nr:hypothetical protein K439DRAFT_1666018 [Ramaria rubella]KAF8584724.1 hypothetical protein K439DRAFT_1660645 [Ramaria rubella]
MTFDQSLPSSPSLSPINPFIVNLFSLSAMASTLKTSSLAVTSIADVKPNTAKATNELCHIKLQDHQKTSLLSITCASIPGHLERPSPRLSLPSPVSDRTKFYGILSLDNKAKKALPSLVGTTTLDSCSHSSLTIAMQVYLVLRVEQGD